MRRILLGGRLARLLIAGCLSMVLMAEVAHAQAPSAETQRIVRQVFRGPSAVHMDGYGGISGFLRVSGSGPYFFASLWYRTDNTAMCGGGVNMIEGVDSDSHALIWVSFGTNGGGQTGALIVHLQDQLYLGHVGEYESAGSVIACDNSWHHIAVTVSTSGQTASYNSDGAGSTSSWYGTNVSGSFNMNWDNVHQWNVGLSYAGDLAEVYANVLQTIGTDNTTIGWFRNGFGKARNIGFATPLKDACYIPYSGGSINTTAEICLRGDVIHFTIQQLANFNTYQVWLHQGTGLLPATSDPCALANTWPLGCVDLFPITP